MGPAARLHHVKSRQCVLTALQQIVRGLQAELKARGVRSVHTAHLTFGKVLGQGSYGVVTAALMADPCDGAEAVHVAVKHAVPGIASDSFKNPRLEVIEREICEARQLRCLLQEAVTYAQITADVGAYAGVVPLLGLEVVSGGVVSGVVMPRILGKSLAEYCGSSQCHDMFHTLELLEAVARSVAWLHASGWVHGDLKELNVMVPVTEYPGAGVAAGGVAACGPSLIDLGMAVKLAPGEHFKNLGTTSYGTPGYCDLLIESCGCISKASDVYSFGVMMCHAQLHSVPGLSWLVAQCLEACPCDRPAMAQVAEALRACMASFQ